MFRTLIIMSIMDVMIMYRKYFVTSLGLVLSEACSGGGGGGGAVMMGISCFERVNVDI